MDEPVTKRLIISGLTPSITAEDLSRRLTTFGTVKAADGFGLPDGLGNPRSFGYVTLETTVGRLAKCMNLLSGSTWKGAKLRFGEAKPDFKERITLENKMAAEEPPKKKRKRFGAVEAEDMTLVSPENAAQRPGWKVSSMGRITKPVKMRPTHPLPEIIDDKSKKKAGAVKFSDVKRSGEEGEKKKKKRVKDPDTRARRKVIDMTKYGSTHLKGIFLDLDVPLPMPLPERYKDIRPNNEEVESDVDSEDSDGAGSLAKAAKPTPQIVPPKTNIVEPVAGPSNTKAESMPIITHTPDPTHIPNSASIPSSMPTSVPAPPPAPKTKTTKTVANPIVSPALPSKEPSPAISDNVVNIQQEKVQSLNLLNSLFGSNDDDWVGQEDVDSDIDISELVKGDRMLVDDEEPEFEVVPLNTPGRKALSASEEESESEEEEEENEDAKQDDKMDIDQRAQSAPEETPAPSSKPKTLKDLFAPREEEAGFSLLGHLDLDIELDEDLLTSEITAPQQPELYESQGVTQPTAITLQTHPSQAPLVLDPKQALFFPLSRQERDNNTRARQRDVFDLAKDNGWNWRDPAVGFYRTGTEEDIRKRWEESKGELTRDWKRRCREAGKVNRRKRGGVEGDNEY